MHGATPTARAAGRLTEQLSDDLPRRHALGQRMPVSPVRTEDDIVRPQMRAAAGRYGFLTDVGVAGAGDVAGLVAPGELLLGPANVDHLAIEMEDLLLRERVGCVQRGRHLDTPIELRQNLRPVRANEHHLFGAGTE